MKWATKTRAARTGVLQLRTHFCPNRLISQRVIEASAVRPHPLQPAIPAASGLHPGSSMASSAAAAACALRPATSASSAGRACHSSPWSPFTSRAPCTGTPPSAAGTDPTAAAWSPAQRLLPQEHKARGPGQPTEMCGTINGAATISRLRRRNYRDSVIYAPDDGRRRRRTRQGMPYSYFHHVEPKEPGRRRHGRRQGMNRRAVQGRAEPTDGRAVDGPGRARHVPGPRPADRDMRRS